MKAKEIINNKKGYAAIISVLLVTGMGLTLVYSISHALVSREKIARNVLGASTSFYSAESAFEDLFLRMVDPDLGYDDWANDFNLTSSTASVDMWYDTPDGRVIEGTSSEGGYTRNIRVHIRDYTQDVSFSYGMQAGQGGVYMKNDSSIVGSLYSNGDVEADNDASITGSVWVSGAGELEGMTVGGNAYAHTIDNSDITGDAYYQNIISTNVDGDSYPGSEDPEVIDLPISDELINIWKQAVTDEGTEILGDYLLEGSDTVYLGLTKIVGNLNIKNDARLTMGGIIWVTGDVNLENDGVLELDSVYEENSGILIVDGKITFKNDFIICGSEGYNTSQENCNDANGSYVMLLSTASGTAIELSNDGYLNGILYAGNGTLLIKNDGILKEATAYRIELENDAQIIYESGLEDIDFSTQQLGSWYIDSWEEYR